jgi:hypothetical protein
MQREREREQRDRTQRELLQRERERLAIDRRIKLPPGRPSVLAAFPPSRPTGLPPVGLPAGALGRPSIRGNEGRARVPHPGARIGPIGGLALGKSSVGTSGGLSATLGPAFKGLFGGATSAPLVGYQNVGSLVGLGNPPAGASITSIRPMPSSTFGPAFVRGGVPSRSLTFNSQAPFQTNASLGPAYQALYGPK